MASHELATACDPVRHGGLPVSGQVRLAVLGSIRGWRNGVEFALRPPQARAVLAVLLARVGRPVSVTDMLDVVWGPQAPDAAANAVHVHVRTLRRLLEPELVARDGGEWLLRGSGGYQIDGTHGVIDLLEFRGLIDQARSAQDTASVVTSYRSALKLWTGPIAGNIDATVRSHPLFQEVERECMEAARTAADAALAAGQATAMLQAIHTIAERDILDESMQARLVLLLAAAGRQAQALERFELVRRTLADELGVDPGEELTAAHREVLRPAAVIPLTSTGQASAAAGPAQLPPDLPTFTGRVAELAAAAALKPDGGAVWPLITVVGMAGVGKTALAVRLAHEVADRYPDGQLFVNLRGFDPGSAPTDPADALHGFLEAFGITAAKVPRTLDGMVTSYRSLLAGRRVLVVLDNARDAEQVRPLLPGSRGCLTVVTSRTTLSGLAVTNGAHPLPLQALSTQDALDLLAHRLGRERVDAQAQAATAIIRYCGGLPLALAVVAAAAATDPALSLEAIAADLAATHGRLDAFAATEAVTDVRAVFSWSYQALSAEAARLLRLLGTARVGPDIGVAAAASLAGVPLAQVRPLLSELLQASLVSRSAVDRYVLHDLIAAFAAETATGDGERQAALHRLLDYYRLTALAAERLYLPVREPIQPDLPAPPVEGPTDRDAAEAWLTAERLTLLDAVRQAAALGMADHAWHIAWSTAPFLHLTGQWDDMRTGLQLALAACSDTADAQTVANICVDLGIVTTELGLHEEAQTHLVRAGEIFGTLGDRRNQGRVSRQMAYLCVQRDSLAEALAHTADALAHTIAAGYRAGEASALNFAAWIHVLAGEPALAIDNGERAIAIFQEVGNEPGVASSWDTLGHAHHKLGDFARAEDCYLAALSLRRKQRSRVFEADILHRLGDNHLAAGASDKAREHWKQALVIMEEMGGPGVEELRRKVASSAAAQADHVTVHRR
ncbi:SARP family transcriptional regulator [Rhizocola hellebori]|uniref:SARP family transcriptional regulator n=1 Tax=Rhizocola hellebori TaxID=1392758 RepID=A0A8J3Q2S7_9ACTN|nr:BTAD domain-containing putative transcriptional regulator [Rhizocola hellebori]GIH02790.1 SARP family transcriptional regulator [Rhizocola hellebori]